MNLIVRHAASAYLNVAEFLKSECSFSEIHLVESLPSIRAKKAYVFAILQDVVWLLRKRVVLNDANVFCMGWTTAALLFLAELRLIRPRKVVWWAFFLHGGRAKAFMRRLAWLFRSAHLEVVVFSEVERLEYAKLLKLPIERFHYFRYGDWSDEEIFKKKIIQNGYYFSGGYSNRDYSKLIEIFSQCPFQLVIAGSSKNKELLQQKGLSENIVVELDSSSERFEQLLVGAKAVILPFKSETGASGQSVMLRCLRNGKAVIANRNSTIAEYLIDGVNGVVCSSLGNGLLPAIKRLETEPLLIDQYGKNAARLYADRFSRTAMQRQLKDLLKRIL